MSIFWLPRLDKNFMKKVVGEEAVELVNDLPNGDTEGPVKVEHLHLIIKAYRKEVRKFEKRFLKHFPLVKTEQDS